MIDINELYIRHYWHPSNVPFRNICRLTKDEAVLLGNKIASGDPASRAQLRYSSDIFEGYYTRRIEVDCHLYKSFVSMGGKPKESFPLFFVLHESKTLETWLGKWNIIDVFIKDIPSEYISFTLDDSMVSFKRDGKCTMYTKEMIIDKLSEYDGDMNDYIIELNKKYLCIEAQLWNDDFVCMQTSLTAEPCF
jgi:hypothetical protein